MAGRIGTGDQFKVGVFGPVVNLAARLESLTKIFRVPILIDSVPAGFGERTGIRMRKVAKVVPAGMTSPVEMSELLLPAAERMDLSEVQRLDYESALDAFAKGKWANTAKKLLGNDGPSEFLKQFMAANPAGPPPDWDGIIRMTTK
jgi:adenylate cyclase